MKKLLLNIILCLPAFFAGAQAVYEIVPEPTCWYISEQDSSLTRYLLVSSRTPGQISILGYVNAAGDVVDVSAGGFFTPGYCDCCNGSGSGAGDQDWLWPTAEKTNLNPIFHIGKVSVFTQDTTHGLRVDSDFQFNPEGLTTFDYQNLTDTTGTNYRGLLYRSPGTFSGSSNLSGGSNNFTIAKNAVPADRDRLGVYAFGGKVTGVPDIFESAWMEAFAEGAWTGINRASGINFYVTNGTTPYNIMTLEKGGRIEFDVYNTFEDGVPTRLAGYNNTSRDVTAHTIDGTSSDGMLIGRDADGLAWIHPDSISGATNLSEGLGLTKDTTFSSTGTAAVTDRDFQYATPPTPSTSRHKSTAYTDPSGERVNLYDPGILDYSLARFDYTTASISTALSLNVPDGVQVEIRGTNVKYLTQAGAVSGYTTDSVAVIPLAGGNYAVIQSDIIYDLEDWGIVAGTGLAKAQRTENWRRYKKLHDFAFKTNNGRLNIKLKESKTYEFYVHDGSGWAAPAQNLVIDIDLGGSSLIFYPLVPQYYELAFAFTNASTIKMNVRNGSILAFRPSRETYEATIKPSGNLDTIILTSSAIRAAFDGEINGKQILISYDYDEIADTITVTDYNPTTKILTLSRNINLPSAINDDAGWIGVPWLQTTNVDTINLYRAYWVESDNGGDTGLDYGWFSPQSGKKMEITFSKIKTEGFGTFFTRSGGDGTMRFEQSDLSAHVIVATNYHNTPVYGVLQVEDCYVHDTGYESKGHHPLNISGASDRYNAGTFYTHPNAKVLFNNVRFKNAMVSLRQYSAGADKPLTDFKHHSEIRNCEFIDQQDQYHIYTSDRVPTIISNCYFNGNNVWLRGHTIIENTTFDTVNIASFGSQLPGETYVKIENSIMRGGTYLSASGESDEKEKWIIKDSKWEIPVNLVGNYFGGTTHPDSLIIENTTFYRNSDTDGTFNGFFSANPEYLRFRNVDIDLHPNDEIFQRWSYNNADAIFENIKLTSGRISALNQVSTGVRPFVIKGLLVPNGSENAFGNFIFLEKEFENNYNSNVISNTTLTFTDPSTLTLPSASTFRLSGNYNHHRIDGTAKRVIFSSSTTDWSSQSYYRGLFTLECSGAGVTIPKYNPATADSVSNFMFDLGLSDKEQKQIYFDPYAFAVGTNATSTMTDEPIGTTTTAKKYTLWQQINPGSDINPGYRIIPGTVTIKVNGVTFGVDDGRGNISGALGNGSVSYFKNYVELRFASTPAAGEAITITSDYVNRASGFHYVGAFYDAANVPADVISGTGTLNQVAVFSAGNTISSSANLVFTSNKLGVNSSTPTDFFEVSGTRTATGNAESVAEVLGTLTGNNSVGTRYSGLAITSSINAGANSQIMTGLSLGNTFNAGAFTGTKSFDLYFTRNNPSIGIASGGLIIQHNSSTNEQFRVISTSIDFLKSSALSTGYWGRYMSGNGGTFYLGFNQDGKTLIGNINASSPPTITAQLHVQGVNTSSADNSFLVENSAGTDALSINNASTISANQYGVGSKEASDLSKTQSIYHAVYATDGTILERRVNYGTASGTPDGSGDLTVAHGLGITPTIILFGPNTASNYTYYWHTADGTNFKIRVTDAAAGTAVTAGTVSISWEAK